MIATSTPAPAGRTLITSIAPGRPESVLRRFTVFGTFGDLLVTRPAALKPGYRILRAELAAIDLACSRFRSDSEISAVNRAAGHDVSISPLLFIALAVALRAAEATDGDVDLTCGRSLACLGYDRDFADIGLGSRGRAPEPVPAGGWQHVELNTRAGTVRVPAGVQLDLGATAKAYAADRCAAAIAAACRTGVLVNLGGDIAVAGPPPVAGWSVGIAATPADAAGPGGHGPVIGISDGGLATSGSHSRSWQAGGQRLHHILVPGSGRPAESCWSAVTVAAASCVDANIASTAAVIRSHAAPRWLAGLGLPARLAGTDGTIVTVGGWPE